jgi:hypothetical protein
VLRSHYEGVGADAEHRTRTPAIPGPYASVTSHQRWSEWSDSNRHRKAWKACRQPLPHIRIGSAYGYRTRPSTLAPWNAASTLRPNSGRRCRRPTDILQLSKSPFISNRLVGSQGIEPRVPIGEIGVTGRQRTTRSCCPFDLATVPGLEPGPRSFGGSCASVTPHCRSRLDSF